jgi:hypothetical protein
MKSKLATSGLAVAAAMLALVPASAFAGKAPLVLEHEGTPAADGSPGSIGINIEECGLFSNGKVVTNDSATDVLSGTSSSEPECAEPGVSISGLITQAKLESSGKAGLTGSITIKYAAGPCEYTFTKFKASFRPGGYAFPEGTASGKVVKGTSASSCAKKESGKFLFTATYEPFGEPFEAKLG